MDWERWSGTQDQGKKPHEKITSICNALDDGAFAFVLMRRIATSLETSLEDATAVKHEPGWLLTGMQI